MSGVEHTTKFISVLSTMVVEAISISKNGVGFSALRKAMGMIGEMKVMLSEAKGALPELKDLDKDEALQLGELAYKCIADIISAAADE